MKKYFLAIAICVLAISVSPSAFALDAPHNLTNSHDCADCHSGYGDTPPDAACNACHINDTGGGYSKNNAPKVLGHSSATTSTKYGTWSQQCKDCHYKHSQAQRDGYTTSTYVATGTITSSAWSTSSGMTTYTYNNLSILRSEWSDPATWGAKSANLSNGNERGLIIYPKTTDFSISSEISSATSNTIIVKGNPGTVQVGSNFAIIYGQFISTSINTPSGSKGAAFFSNQGANSFAYDNNGTGTDSSPDGICQVCHTQTNAWRANGTLAGVVNHAGTSGTNCVLCHAHENGFAASCSRCHGSPPVDAQTLVKSPNATGSVTAGAHDKHSNILGYDCTVCHNSKGTGAWHNDGTVHAVTMGFKLFDGAVQGGSYDGQTGVDYNTTSPNTTPATTVTNTGTLQCGNIYCHSTGQASNGGALTSGDYKTPAWNGSVQCGSCHKGDGAQGDNSLMDSGSHTKHVNAIQIDCASCHNSAGYGTAAHLNNAIEIAFNQNPDTTTGAYSQSPNTPGNGYGNCSTVYCHSSVQGANGSGAPLVYTTPTWGQSATCGSCHASPPTTGSHSTHLSIYAQCSTCHNNAGSNTVKHADANIDVEFNSAGGSGTYSQIPNIPGNGYGTCSTTNCHGTSSPQWSTDLSAYDQCTKCHGTQTASPAPDYAKAPHKDTAGNTTVGDRQVGAHQTHLRAFSGISGAVACNECHVVPGTVTAAGHIDSALPAELTFGTLASTGSLTPSYDAGTGTCSNTYCHGNAMPKGTTEGAFRSPVWNDYNYITGNAATDCARCHGYPPVSLAVHAGASAVSCTNCHSNVNASGTGFADPDLHINGIVEALGDDCADCHTNANLSGSHLTHTDPDSVLSGKKLSSSDFGNVVWWYSYSNTGGVPLMGCGYCHPRTTATHMNGIKNLNFDPAESGLPGGTLKGLNGQEEVFSQATGSSVTCSSVYCHSNGHNGGLGYVYQPSPDWYGGSFVGDKCSNCHGNSPNSGGKPGSLSHYNPDSMGMGAAGGHFVGIHYKNVFSGSTGLIKDGSNRQNAHGTASTMSTINCQTCHNSTVTTSANDENTVCVTCHTGGSAKGSMIIAAGSTTHINGIPDVAFAAGTINSKAQIRDDITLVSELNNSWARNSGYKAWTTSHDGSKTAASYNSGSKSCSSVACHNGNPVTWGATNIACNSCHTSLP